MDHNALHWLRQRRTVRRFTADDVKDDEIETLLEMAMYAPNRLNRQPWHFVVIRDAKIKKGLSDLLRVHPYLEAAPVVIAVASTYDTSPTWLMDISAATENLLLAATALGLGSAWIGSPDTVMWDIAEEWMHDTLGIPFSVRIPTLVAVGHPAEQPEPHSREDRWDRSKVHYDCWGNHNESGGRGGGV